MLRGVQVEVSAVRTVGAAETESARASVSESVGAVLRADLGVKVVEVRTAAGALTGARAQTTANPAFIFIINDAGTDATSVLSSAEVERRLSAAVYVSDVANTLDSAVEEYGE